MDRQSSGKRSHRRSIILLIILALTIIAADLSGVGAISLEGARQTLREGLTKILSGIQKPFIALEEIAKPTLEYNALLQENADLRQQLHDLPLLEAAINELRLENRSLKQILKINQNLPQPYLVEDLATARVVAYGSAGFPHSVIINLGQAAGIAAGFVAINNEGLVGRVIDAGENSARVLLLADIASRVPVETLVSGYLGIASGRNDSLLQLDYLTTTNAIEGEVVVTSGHGGIFPAGIPIGTLMLEEDKTSIKPFTYKFNLGWIRVIPPIEAKIDEQITSPNPNPNNG